MNIFMTYEDLATKTKLCFVLVLGKVLSRFVKDITSLAASLNKRLRN